ncbi:uncharacterized protein CANTADRAFT_88856 [Suhomyces tanzawaensis NRRL Y-17324]|uniref:CBS domain-containing protein n=1 Tax=Suhomyces tanzawaensis NRRL Y-17324 TaxID=984487 RepID=A0A1E4SN93_9ASCO|nr:uncharacterized protein CANTADRAFT_88856 [Suhomyces tanzawaensis NRRL Y-17324]ODV80958.1 hypothetical protein CANTADRAFT_88856 [Suhomyces tanzawaensis NRRL Y-17324]
MPNPPFRQPPTSPLSKPTAAHHGHPHHNHHPSFSSGSSSQHPSRKPSIVELLSSPPPLPVQTPDHDDIHGFSLSRHTSNSSRSSSVMNAAQHASTSGLDWSEIPLKDLTESNKLITINASYSVQKAFETLVTHNLTSIPVLLSSSAKDCLTFDYSDLNTYLLLIMNKISTNDLAIHEIDLPLGSNTTPGTGTDDAKKHELVTQTISRAKRGEEVPVEFIIKLNPKNPFIKFSETDTLFPVVETLGNGVHRIAITDSDNKITGILSQRRLIKYLWENARRFPSLDCHLNSTLQELDLGSSTPISIYEDQLLIDALQKMSHERVSSLAVIDRTRSLIGNISIVDVKHVSTSKNSHLLFKPVLNFISYNLSQKGIEEGQDQFPIFHVNNQSSLGRVIAKLVATQSHRLWVVESSNRNHSNSMSSTNTTSSASSVNNGVGSLTPATVEATLGAVPSSNYTPTEAGRPGKLVGVVTLTDILGLFASAKGKKTDPSFARNQRRGSTSSATRSSFESLMNPASTSASTTAGGGAPNEDIFRKSYVSSQKSDNVFSK